MFGNYFRTAFRNIGKSRLFSAINVLGLAIGLMAAMMIVLYARFELSYDQAWSKADRLYRVDMTFKHGFNPKAKWDLVSGRLQAAYMAYFPDDIEAATRFRTLPATIRQGADVSTEQLTWADAAVLDMFEFKTLRGSMARAFADTSSLAINATFAKRYFGDSDPIGQVLSISSFNLKRDYRVAAVYEDMPANSVLTTLKAVALMDEKAFETPNWLINNWGSTSVEQYLLLKPGHSIDTVNRLTPAMLDKFVEVGHGKGSDVFAFSATPLSRFHSDWVSFDELSTRTKVELLITIAVVLVLIGAVNFVNLATARAIRRTREVALRKVLGARRGQLITQFLTESYLITVLASLIAVVLLELALPYFSVFLDKPLTLGYADPFNWLMLCGIVLVVGGLAGFYPAFAISGSRPGRILLANKSAESRSAVIVRQILVTFQFAVSIVLIVATLVIYGQTWYVVHMNPGYDRDNLLVVQQLDRTEMAPNRKAFLKAVSQLPGVRAASLSSETPSDDNNNFTSAGRTPERGQMIDIGELWVDANFFPTYGIPVIAGRNFSDANEADSYVRKKGDDMTRETRIMINETGYHKFGFESAEQAVGGLLYWGSGAPLRIIGVVKDARTQSMADPLGPEIYLMTKGEVDNMTVRFSGSPAAIVDAVGKVWKQMAPFTPYEYTFVDDAVAHEFEQERHMSGVLTFFSALAVIVACMGLYGLAAFSAERRTREIGIRKVLGARVGDIVMLLLQQFSRPVLIANLIAWPVAFWVMTRWLQQYPNRIESWYLIPACVAAGLAAFLIAWITVGGNAARVARANPIKALRYE